MLNPAAGDGKKKGKKGKKGKGEYNHFFSTPYSKILFYSKIKALDYR